MEIFTIATAAALFFMGVATVTGAFAFRSIIRTQKAQREESVAKKKYYDQETITMQEVGRQIASGNAKIHGVGPVTGFPFPFPGGACTNPSCPIHGKNSK